MPSPQSCFPLFSIVWNNNRPLYSIVIFTLWLRGSLLTVVYWKSSFSLTLSFINIITFLWFIVCSKSRTPMFLLDEYFLCQMMTLFYSFTIVIRKSQTKVSLFITRLYVLLLVTCCLSIVILIQIWYILKIFLCITIISFVNWSSSLCFLFHKVDPGGSFPFYSLLL